MIYLYKVFGGVSGKTPNIVDYYRFNTDDIEFDMLSYDISLNMVTYDYYLLSDTNIDEIYYLSFVNFDTNPKRILISKDDEIYNLIREAHMRKTMEKIYVTKTVKFEDSINELDFVNRETFGWEDWDLHDFVEINKGNVNRDDEPIEINSMIELLQRAKDAGSTHVNIDYHTGHHGYDISGVEMRKSTQEEIDNYEEFKSSIKDIDAQIKKLNGELSKLTTERMELFRKRNKQ